MPVRFDKLQQLTAPFKECEIQWRPGAVSQDGQTAIAMAYVDARTVQQRLDEICGPGDWQCTYECESHSEVERQGANRTRITNTHWICKISILVEDENQQIRWVSKSDAAGATAMEAVKGGVSDAFKRAAVLWGVGRSLYSLPAQRCHVVKRGRNYKLAEQPQLPKWYLEGHMFDPSLDAGQTMQAMDFAPPPEPQQVEPSTPQEAGIDPADIWADDSPPTQSMGQPQEAQTANPFHSITPPTQAEAPPGLPPGINVNWNLKFGKKILSDGRAVRDCTWADVIADSPSGELRGYATWMARLADENEAQGKPVTGPLATARKIIDYLDNQ